MSDIVAELDRWLAWYEEYHRAPTCDAVMVRRARDEIVMWRIGPFALAMTERGKFIRAEALEEAAQVCERNPDLDAFELEQIIRALKDKPS